jgi:hypothetical protein
VDACTPATAGSLRASPAAPRRRAEDQHRDAGRNLFSFLDLSLYTLGALLA